MIGIVLLVAEKSFENATIFSLLVPGIYWANLFILILQMLGWLSNPFVTAVYFMEQGEILFFGGTARASDMRIFASFAVNCLLVIIFTHTDISTDENLTVVYAVAAFLLSKNYLHTLGLKQPFKVENEDMIKQRAHADIVFAGLEPNPEGEIQLKKEKVSCSMSTIIFNVVELILVLASAIIFQVLYSSDDAEEVVYVWHDGPDRSRKDLVVGLSNLASILALLILIVSSLSKRCCLRCIPCPNLPVPSIVTRITNHLM